MEHSKIPLIDRLRDRGFVDQWGFAIFATAGSLAIISAKWFGAEARWIAIGAVLLMAIYAAIIARAGTGRLRADQAGDNCYYLGLIFTLASLSYAIAFFDPSNAATTIVQGFGVALATTVCGLILRVFFNQGRPDLENIEEQTRLELTDAASKLKTELSQVVVSMNDFGRQMKQSLSELRDATAKDMEDLTRSSVDGLREVVHSANESIRSEANDFAARSKRYTGTFDKLLAKLDGHADNLARIGSAHEAMLVTVTAVGDSAESARATVATIREGGVQVSQTLEVLGRSGDLVSAALEQLNTAVGAVRSNLSDIHSATDAHLERLRKGPEEAVGAAVASLRQAAESLSEHVARVGDLHEKAGQNLAAQSADALNAVRVHNDALQTELERSRGLVAKVHTALSEMTESLAARFEAPA